MSSNDSDNLQPERAPAAKPAKEIKFEKIEIKEHKDAKHEKLEKNEIKEHKDAKHEKLEKIEVKEHKDAKHEHKELSKIENKELTKLEHGEKPAGKEKDGKEIAEGGGLGPIGDPERQGGPIGAGEAHFIAPEERPDLSRGALSGEPPASETSDG